MVEINFNPQPNVDPVGALNRGLSTGLGFAQGIQGIRKDQAIIENQKIRKEHDEFKSLLNFVSNPTFKSLPQARKDKAVQGIAKRANGLFKTDFPTDITYSSPMSKVAKEMMVILNNKGLSAKDQNKMALEKLLEEAPNLTKDEQSSALAILEERREITNPKKTTRAGERVISEFERLKVLERGGFKKNEIKNGVTDDGIPIPKTLTQAQADIIAPRVGGLNITTGGDPEFRDGK